MRHNHLLNVPEKKPIKYDFQNNCFGIWYKYFSTSELFVTFLFIVSYCIELQFKPEGKHNRLLQVRQITVPFNWFSSVCLWMANQW
jgi:hypothetical protein